MFTHKQLWAALLWCINDKTAQNSHQQFFPLPLSHTSISPLANTCVAAPASMVLTLRQVITASACEVHSYLSTARKRLTHTYSTHTQTEDNNHEIFLYVLFSPFGNPRVNIFINHITGHDAPKFTLSVYRNTLNRTQGFTMDTQLTFCPLHLQQ